MTTSTILSGVSQNQNAQGTAGVVNPAPSTVNYGAEVTRQVFTLTVSPATGWAKAVLRGSNDGQTFWPAGEMFVAPNSGGSVTSGANHNPPVGVAGTQYVTGEVTEVSPGATATLTVTY